MKIIGPLADRDLVELLTILLDRIELRDNGCWEWLGTRTAQGYTSLSFHGVSRTAHSWAWRAFHGAIPEGMEVDHLCRNRACVNPEHLEPVTTGENVRRGYRVKLSVEKVAEIKNLFSAGNSVTELAKLFFVSHSLVSMVIKGKRWKV